MCYKNFVELLDYDIDGMWYVMCYYSRGLLDIVIGEFKGDVYKILLVICFLIEVVVYLYGEGFVY